MIISKATKEQQYVTNLIVQRTTEFLDAFHVTTVYLHFLAFLEDDFYLVEDVCTVLSFISNFPAIA